MFYAHRRSRQVEERTKPVNAQRSAHEATRRAERLDATLKHNFHHCSLIICCVTSQIYLRFTHIFLMPPRKTKTADVSAKKTERKRKTNAEVPSEDATSTSPGPSVKRQRTSRSNSKGKEVMKPYWPEYFDELYKVFKALNTVLAFFSSRKSLAVTFTLVRKSVENLLKRPLDLTQVAELKAILPNLIQFAYIPRVQLQIHEDSRQHEPHKKDEAYAAFDSARSAGPSTDAAEEEEHVLVLDFEDPSRGSKASGTGLLVLPASLSPGATKKLIEKRNEIFISAVNELIQAIPDEEDPVALVRAAAREHIPIDPSNKSSLETVKTASQNSTKVIPDPDHRLPIESIVVEMQMQDWYVGQMRYHKTFEAREAQIATLDTPLSDNILQALRDARKITSFYAHQVAAINALDQGEHVIVSTSTASGKSIIYQVPFLKFLEENRSSTAIFIYPTKALAQDQKKALEQLLFACPGLEHIKVCLPFQQYLQHLDSFQQVDTYDGDTLDAGRRAIRETASVIFTNFDMLHFSILPHEEQWRRFLKDLKLVAVDELHYYIGTFGSHVAQVLRRFRRICAAVGNRRVQFVSCSATIANPALHMTRMFGVENVGAITEDGAPSGEKEFIVWEPPLVDINDPSMGHRSSLTEAVCLARFLMERGVRIIIFCTIRKSCELFFKALRADLTAHGRIDILERVMPYRGGYTPADRRRIEKEAFEGQLLGIVATNALELGVDIGVLDAVMMFGFPRGGVASFRQQAGRAGRRARDSLAVFIGSEYPIDKHYIAHPEELYEKPLDEISIDIDNKILLEAHLQCAGQEMPLSMDDEKYFGPSFKAICETRLIKDDEGWYTTHPKFLPHPAKYISLRGGNEDEYCVVDVSRVGKPGGVARILEQMEMSRALFELYEGAVFIHQGVTFLITEVSHDSKMAKLIRSDVNWTTEPRDFTDVDASKTLRIREIRGSPHLAYYGTIDVMTIVFGYFKVRDKKIIDAVDVETPPWRREANGLWMDVPHATLELLKANSMNPAEAIHAAEHAFLNRFTLADDMGTECKAAEKEYKSTETKRKRPARLIFYESAGRNGGNATKAFDHVSDLLIKAHNTVESCPCETGCAACIVSPNCRENNLVISKPGALVVLKALLGKPVDVDLLVPSEAKAYETVVAAAPVRAVEGVQREKAD
ncbi:hypothetical protein NM688_g67 [Phlebia brevispora]|uniref:Uncharacterized protein n=1 Tax=Phlebia brevispora TaxID=194682 RepID=A0ACC1TG48_9APHY|nr:hypothetical protein NM688_g67 [Phlebia brevispora]